MHDRRTFIAASGASLALAALGFPPAALAENSIELGQPEPFSFDALVARAREMAAQSYAPPPPLPADVLDRIDYEALGKLSFDADYALFKDGPGQFPVTFFPLGRFFRTGVRMHVLDGADTAKPSAREIRYDPKYFDMPADSPARALPENAGFAGFRLQESRLADPAERDWRKNDWVAFLGASYFRAIGESFQYGLSARGVALDAAMPGRAEEFPAFTHFYFESPPQGDKGGDTVVVYALLDGPGITGAYKFAMQRGKKVLMDIDSHLFLRRDVGRLGLVPLTSMFWYSETRKPEAIDWRPEVHDSDGLAMWSGNGERIWRPLVNPKAAQASAFADKNPRGFGLLQRDRVFDHFEDGVNYERRPSLWVEPLGEWGDGAVQLIEIPTDDEIHDNILACWVPAAPAKAGATHHLRYRLHWADDEPSSTQLSAPLAQCVATRIGRGGQPGQPRPAGVRKFMVEFSGAPLAALPFGVKPEAVLTSASGKFSYVFTEAVPDGVAGHWRAQFDFTAQGDEPVDLRLFLRNGEQTLTETWLYQFRAF